MLSILWTIIIGFIAGVLAKFVTPGSTYEPKGFILTTALGIVGALVATYLGQALGWYHSGEKAGFIGAIVGAVLIGGAKPSMERSGATPSSAAWAATSSAYFCRSTVLSAR